MMMNPEQLVDCFNEKSLEFVSDLCRLVPEDTDIRAFKSSLRLLTAVDGQRAIRMFAEHVSEPYRRYIETRDDSFFLSDGFRVSHEDNLVRSLIAKVGEYWTRSITPADRDVVWDYIELLHALADKHALVANRSA